MDEIQFIPKQSTPVSGDDVAVLEKFLDLLNDVDDVQNVYTNADFSDEVMAQLS